MSTTAQNPEITPIPVHLSAPEFTAFIFPHLSMPKRGPRGKRGSHRLFTLILGVLYTGMPWKCLPMPKGPTGKPELHYTHGYKAFARWADDGALDKAFVASVGHLADEKTLDLRVLHGDGTNTVAKSGRRDWLLGLQAPAGGASHRHHRQPWLRAVSPPSGTRQ